MGNSLISRLKDKHFNTIEDIREILKPDTSVGSGEWIDLSGLIAPKTEIEQLMKKIEDQPITLEDIQSEFEKMHEAYYNYEWTWAKEKLEIYWGKPIAEVTREDLIQMVELWKNSVVTLDHLIYDDAKKEFSLNAKTGFGVDGDEQQKSLDFESVRGSFENNPFVLEVINHIKIKSELGDELLDRLKKVIN